MTDPDQLLGYDPAAGALVPVCALVDHPHRDVVRIRYSKNCQVATFQAHGQPLEVMLACEGYDSFRVKVDQPEVGRFMMLKHDHVSREFRIEYYDGR